MTLRPAWVVPCLLFICLLMAPSFTWATSSSAGIRLAQANGGTLTLPAPARRIITLAPNLAELVFAAGAGEHLLAVVEYSNFPEPVTALPRVGDAFRIDLERVVAMKPDLVLAWHSGNPPSALQKLEQLGLRIWQLEITRPEEIANAVEAISIAAATQATGSVNARQLRERLASIVNKHTGKPPVSYFYQVAERPLYTISGQHIISHGLATCGGSNIFAGLPALAPQVSLEAVIAANPLLMIAPDTPGETPALAHWQGWPQLKAVGENNMLYLPADEISQATPRLLNSLETACDYLDEVRFKTETKHKP